MPNLPAVHRPLGWRQRKAWERSAGQVQVEHKLPKNWPQIRRHILSVEPLCRPCRKAGIVRAATQVDHIVARSQGGTHDRSNLQPICSQCHALKTAAESRQVAG